MGRHSGYRALQQEGPGYDSQLGSSCVEFACSPRVLCVFCVLCVWLFVSISQPCDELVTGWTGWTPPLTRCQLGKGPAPCDTA